MKYISIGVLALLAIGGAIYFLSSSSMYDTSPESQNSEKVISIDPSGVLVTAAIIAAQKPPPPGYVEYRNETFGFSFWHTPQGKVTEYPEDGGAATIVLENEERKRGLQIFIVPYSDTEISEERFRADVPSGVRNNVESTVLDGTEAVTFTSQDFTLGETREIWFIKGGFLYEITTFKGVGNWLVPIIQSWRFL